MTLEEAIAILTACKEPESIKEAEALDKATKLGTEALKWINQWRGVNSALKNIRLPGETWE